MMTRMARGLLVGAVMTALVGCENVEERMSLRKPTAQMTGMRFQDADAYGATVVFDAQIQNHYPEELPLLRFSYAVSSQGKRFMAGTQEVAVRIPIGGSQMVSLPTRIDYPNMLRLLGGVRPGATIPYEAQVDLTINTPRLGWITLPLGRSGEVTLPAMSGADVQTPPGGEGL